MIDNGSVANHRFPHHWKAQILPARPLILPRRHFVYPGSVEEVERGALELLVHRDRPAGPEPVPQPLPEPFLATCALGFRDPAMPSGVWPMPHPDWLCAISGGYAYLVDVTQPEHFIFLRYRPVLAILDFVPESAPESGLLLFVGHHTILAWGRDGEAWESDRLSWEGVTVERIEDGILHGTGWDLRTDKDLPFALDLRTGRRI